MFIINGIQLFEEILIDAVCVLAFIRMIHNLLELFTLYEGVTPFPLGIRNTG